MLPGAERFKSALSHQLSVKKEKERTKQESLKTTGIRRFQWAALKKNEEGTRHGSRVHPAPDTSADNHAELDGEADGRYVVDDVKDNNVQGVQDQLTSDADDRGLVVLDVTDSSTYNQP